MKRKTRTDLPDVPWITAEGYLDPAKFPIDSTLQQSVHSNPEEVMWACRMLASMVSHGRTEAGIYLLGLLRYYQDDLSTLGTVVESLGQFKDPRCAAALFDELRRVPSSNKTRGYLKNVITALLRFPTEMVQDGFRALSQDPAFSYKMRAKFKEAAELDVGYYWSE